MKSAVSPRSGSVFIDQNGDIVNSSSPILLKQPSSAAVSVGQLVSKTKPLPPGVIQSPGGGAPVGGPRNADNKTCMWKFENGQVPSLICYLVILFLRLIDQIPCNSFLSYVTSSDS